MVNLILVVTKHWIIAFTSEKFQKNPTITGLDTNFQITKLVFPTVLVCPEDPFDEGSVVEVAFNRLSGENSEISSDFEDLLQGLTTLSLTNLQDFQERTRNITSTRESAIDKEKLRDLMFLVGIKCEQVFNSCKFKDDELECCDHFAPIYTERGFCYGFNLKYVYSESGMDYLENNEAIFELLETDKKWSLVIYPKISSKIYIHSRVEISSLEMMSPAVSWFTDYSVDLLVSMKQTITTEDTKQLSVGWGGIQIDCIIKLV